MRAQRLTAVWIGAACVCLLVLPFLLPAHLISVATRILIFGLFAVAYNVVFGMGGMPALGHAAFFGTAGYVVALGTTRWDWGAGTIVGVVILTGTLLGIVFGIVAARAARIYLLLVTFALAQAVWASALAFPSLTRGDSGIPNVLRSSLHVALESRTAFYFLVLSIFVASLLLIKFFLDTPAGMAVLGLRESPSRLASLGYNVAYYKVAAFGVSGLFSAIAGGLAAYHSQFAGLGGLSWMTSATVLLMAILGGASKFLGPAVGAAILISLETFLSMYTTRWMTVLGVIYIVTVLLLPNGVLGSGRARPGADKDQEALDGEGGPAGEPADGVLQSSAPRPKS